ncbi:YaiI/YqxD family protein [Pseudogracilibacillus sp. SE30717A]|uniref:YaiI/YqxD family protein n=1 Tax=Pseudogracilibacillus sp. SE30717A TaxID=3098293 RepID=UPI00300E2739
MNIFVDADASPVQEEVIQIASKFNLEVTLVKSFSHYSHTNQASNVKTVYVDKGADMADFEIIKRARKGDLIVTQDYGLASLGLGKGCLVIHHKGFQYTDKNIDRLLTTRHASALARRGGLRTKGPKPFTEEDRKKFILLLQKLLTESSL